MNLIKSFYQEDFNKFNNIFCIQRKTIENWASGYEPTDFFIKKTIEFDTLKIYKTLNPLAEKKYLLLAIKKKFYPIYGHFFNSSNQFIFKRVYNKKIQDCYYPVRYNLITYNELAQNVFNEPYICSSIDNVYEITKKLNEYELPDIYNVNHLIHDEDEISELYSYTKDSELITEYAEPHQIDFAYDPETEMLHIK